MSTIEGAKSTLEKAGIDTSLYGTGEAKAIEDLHEEIEAGETQLTEDEGALIRSVSVVSIKVVYCRENVPPLRLKEDRQVFSDGRVRRRDYLFGAVSEKMMPGEEVGSAIERALLEEIQVKYFKIESISGPSVNEKLSPSYPGLMCRYSNYEAVVEIAPSEYMETYMEVQGNKTTHFVWVPHE